MTEVDHTKRRQGELSALLQDHNGRVAQLEPFVAAHSLMPRDLIMRAEQQNARRATALNEACRRYSREVQLLVDRHTREQDEERGVGLRQSLHGDPSAESAEADVTAYEKE